jgi:hypothetical protein
MTIEIDGVNNTLKTDKIEPQSGTALQVGASGDTVTLPSGATLNIAGTITNSGTATGFGALDWQTSDVKTSTFTAVAGKGYLVNTTGGAITVNLPAGSAGTQIGLVDYAGTWDSNGCTIAPNGSEKIEGVTQDVELTNERESVTILYQDSTQGWIAISNSDGKIVNPTYIAASGGTTTTSGDYKIHTFNSSGTFTVSSVGNSAGGGDVVSYAVIAGGGGGGTTVGGGGGGAGGYREGKASGDPYTASPLNAPAGLTVTAQAYPITVGGGGSGADPQAASGSNSVFSTITSAGGGYGASYWRGYPGANGGSGGGGTYTKAAGTGNTPPVSPPQGNTGGAGGQAGPSSRAGGGGGGASATGNADSPGQGGDGGNGTSSQITAASVNYAGGGGGSASHCNSQNTGGSGGSGGGGAGGNKPSPGPGTNGTPGTANTGGGGGGSAGSQFCGDGGTGGSGVVIIRYKYQN